MLKTVGYCRAIFYIFQLKLYFQLSWEGYKVKPHLFPCMQPLDCEQWFQSKENKPEKSMTWKFLFIIIVMQNVIDQIARATPSVKIKQATLLILGGMRFTVYHIPWYRKLDHFYLMPSYMNIQVFSFQFVKSRQGTRYRFMIFCVFDISNITEAIITLKGSAKKVCWWHFPHVGYLK